MKFVWLIALLTLSGVAEARDYLKQDRAQSRGFSPGVVTEGGKIVWVSDQTGLVDEDGMPIRAGAGDFSRDR